MIKISVDQNDFNRIVQSMKNIEKSEESVLKTAVNNTAKQVQRRLAKQAGKVYVGQAPAEIFSRSKIIKASVSKVNATIIFQSEQPGIEKHKISGFVVRKTMYLNGKRVKAPVFAAQLKGSMKPLEGESGMAFCVRFKNGKKAVVSRKGKKLKRIMGSSDMVMVRNEKVFGAEEEKIAEILHKQVDKILLKVLGGK